MRIYQIILWLIKIAKDGFSFCFKKEEPEEKDFSDGRVYHDGNPLRDPIHLE